MCDPLGGSQVMPYLFGLARRGHRIDLISFEKPERSAEERAAVGSACAEAGIRWHPLRYHKQPPVLSALYDVRRMYRLAARLHRRRPFDLIHCRSYLPALVGLRMKRRRGVPFIFDMRGFWADERVDGSIWNLRNPLLRMVYRFFKKREAAFLTKAAHVVSLTEEGKKVLLARRALPSAGPPITVIPCCVDFAAFPPVKADDRAEARRLLGIDPETKVAAYLGSFGSWYMVGEMLDFFRVQLERNADSVFLIVSREPPAEIIAAARSRGVPEDRVIVRPAARTEVPRLLAAADYGLFFIVPVFSKKASSPTKMGELLALELPVVTNGDVGDVDRIMAEAGAGVVIHRFDEDSYARALDELERMAPDRERWREAAHRWFDLETGVERYDGIYRSVANADVGSRRGVG
jgi:glycosyltransferase involved in cell wall biosynthesis